MNDLLDYLSNVKDPRCEWLVTYSLSEIIFLTLCATLGNADDAIKINAFGNRYLDVLRNYLPYENGIPSDDRIQTFLGTLNPKVTAECNKKWKDISESVEGGKLRKLLCFDGKTIKGNKTKDQKGIHIVTAYSPDDEISYGQLATEKKSNEIPTIKELLKSLKVFGHVITIDAAGTQKEIAKQIIKENKAHYVLAVKRNQLNLFLEMEDWLCDDANLNQIKDNGGYYRTVERAHSQEEIREYFQSPVVEDFPELGEWEGISSFGVVKKTTYKDGTLTSCEYRYYISSLPVNVMEFCHCIRGHWSVEIMHWHLDVTFREDKDMTVNQIAAQNLNNLRKLALAILKSWDAGPKVSLKTKRYLLSMDFEAYAEKLLSV